jgi:preprotein translocase subunit SecY
MTVILLAVMFFGVTAGAVMITVAQRRIPIQQAKQTRGRKTYGGMKSYLPLRVNHGGVMPIIFAQSLMIFPSVALGALATYAERTQIDWFTVVTRFFAENFNFGRYLYVITEILLIYFFSYFWTTVQFNPKEMSEQLRDHGSFIPGLRPGPRTAEYLETVLERVTYVGAGFLALIAVVPTMISTGLGIPYGISSFLGGTGLLIVVSVGLDFVQRIEANLLMRNYAGFLSGGEHGRAPRVRSGRR